MKIRILVMWLKCRNVVFYLDDRYIQSSPFLRTMLESGLEVTMDSIPQGKAIVLDSCLDPREVKQYLRYLQGRRFTLLRRSERVFRYMGHEVHRNKEIGLWKAELQDEWVKDNFYRLELWKDPYYGMARLQIQSRWSIDHPRGQACAIGFSVLDENYQSLVDYRDHHDTRNINKVRALIGNPSNGTYKCNGDLFLYGKDQDIICWRRIWRSPNEIAFFNPVSCGIVSVDGSNIVAMTHTTRYRMKRDSHQFFLDSIPIFERSIPCIDIMRILSGGIWASGNDDHRTDVPTILFSEEQLRETYHGTFNPEHCHKEGFITFD